MPQNADFRALAISALAGATSPHALIDKYLELHPEDRHAPPAVSHYLGHGENLNAWNAWEVPHPLLRSPQTHRTPGLSFGPFQAYRVGRKIRWRADTPTGRMKSISPERMVNVFNSLRRPGDHDKVLLQAILQLHHWYSPGTYNVH